MSWSWQLRLKPAPKIIDDSEGMASRDQHSQQQNQTRKVPLFPLLSLVCFVSIFLLLSSIRKTSVPPRPHNASFEFQKTEGSNPSLRGGSCDYSDGSWIRSPDDPPRYDNTCKEIFKGWNCISSDKSNGRELLKWRWKPKGCDLPPFHPIRFLKMYRDTSIVQADANGGVLESLGYKEGYRVDVDIPDGTWAEALSFHDILIFNTGHWWWAPSKFDLTKSPMLFFEKGRPVVPPVLPDVGLDMVLKHMVVRMEKRTKAGAIKFFRTQSPRHFEGGDWDQGGSCNRVNPLLLGQVENLFSVKNNGTNVEARLVNQHLYKSLKGSSFQILNITHMSEFRADAPSIHSRWEEARRLHALVHARINRYLE